MTIPILRLLIDFGLVIVIWTIQIIIYPSFLHYSTQNLVAWHRKYVPLIGYIVTPLMFLQLGLVIYQFASAINIYSVISLVVVITVWISTLLQFVPIHSNISKGRTSRDMLLSLVKKNRLRTVLWTFIFILSFLAVLSGGSFLGV